jgi:hypothetical protein
MEKKWDPKEEQLDLDFRFPKEKNPNQDEEQLHFDYRSEEQKDRALIDRILEERTSTGTFSPDTLSKKDKERYLRLMEEERKDDKDYHGHKK